VTDRCRLLGLALAALLVSLPVAHLAWSQDEEGEEGEEDEEIAGDTETRKRAPAVAVEPVEYCVSPEEMAVIELVRHRHWELQQRDELLVVQEQAVRSLQQEIRAEVKRLAELRADIEELLKAREQARREGGDALVGMVNQMKAADAAEMLSRMDPLLAAAVLERLSPRQAGKILGAMDPSVAAALGGSLAMDPIEEPVGEQP
jgi:flagellar motility protein MotE (MotC chaperone)